MAVRRILPLLELLDIGRSYVLDWVRACKGGDPGCADFSITAPYAEWLSLIPIAYRVPGKLDWDSKALRFTNALAEPNPANTTDQAP